MAKNNSKNGTPTCAISKAEFVANVKPLEITINGIPMFVGPKEFSTGSFGWYLSGKVNVKVGDKIVPLQLGLNATVIGSKHIG